MAGETKTVKMLSTNINSLTEGEEGLLDYCLVFIEEDERKVSTYIMWKMPDWLFALPFLTHARRPDLYPDRGLTLEASIKVLSITCRRYGLH